MPASERTSATTAKADNKIVALASTGPKRSAYLPEVPTVIESGIKDFEVLSWNGISVPAGLSSEGTPLGLQLIGKPFDEPTLFTASQVIEDAAGRFEVPSRWWMDSAAASAEVAKVAPKRGGAKKKPGGK